MLVSTEKNKDSLKTDTELYRIDVNMTNASKECGVCHYW